MARVKTLGGYVNKCVRERQSSMKELDWREKKGKERKVLRAAVESQLENM